MLPAIEIWGLLLELEVAADIRTFVLPCLDQSDAAELVHESLYAVCAKKR